MQIPNYIHLDPEIYHRKNEKEIRDKIIMNFLALVKSRMKHFHIEFDDMDDLMSEGMIGLINAVDHFDPDRGVQFITFATSYIDGYIKTFFSHKIPTESLDDEISEDLTRLDTIQSNIDIENEYIDEDYKKYQLGEIEKVLITLPEKHQEVYRALMSGLTIHDVAKMFQLSVEKVNQIMKKVERAIKYNVLMRK